MALTISSCRALTGWCRLIVPAREKSHLLSDLLLPRHDRRVTLIAEPAMLKAGSVLVRQGA